MSREDAQFKLRMPANVKTRIEGSCGINRRSLNAEILARLERTFLPDDVPETSFAAPPMPAVGCGLIDSQMAKISRDKLLRIIDEAIAEAAPIAEQPATEELHKAATEHYPQPEPKCVI